MVDFTLSDVFIQILISFFFLEHPALWCHFSWSDCEQGIVTEIRELRVMCCLSQHEPTCESGYQEAAVWTHWLSCRQMGQQRKLVPFSVTSSLMVVNICSMSLPPQQSLDAGWCHWDWECQMWIFNQQAVKHRLSPQFYCEPSENTTPPHISNANAWI